MNTEKKIKERLDQAVIESHFKPWYQRLTGRIILAIAGVFILLFLYLSWASLSSLLKINNGDVFDKTSGAWISYEDFQAHVAAGCAQAQNKFWEYHDVLFANQENIAKADLRKYAQDLDLDITAFDACVAEEKPSIEIRQDYAQGVDLGVYGTPSYVINGQLISGEVTFEVWEQIIGFIIKEEI